MKIKNTQMKATGQGGSIVYQKLEKVGEQKNEKKIYIHLILNNRGRKNIIIGYN